MTRAGRAAGTLVQSPVETLTCGHHVTGKSELGMYPRGCEAEATPTPALECAQQHCAQDTKPRRPQRPPPAEREATCYTRRGAPRKGTERWRPGLGRTLRTPCQVAGDGRERPPSV